MTTNEKPASPTHLQALQELVDLVANEMMGDCTADDPDEDSVGWSEAGPLPMTFGNIRRAQKAIVELQALASQEERLIRGLSAMVHCQSPLSRNDMREAAAGLLKASNVKPIDFGGDQSPFVIRALAAEAELSRLSALDHTTLPPAEEAHICPICLKPFVPADLCATDIELGTCHAECLAGSPTVDLESGEPVDAPIPTYRYDETEGAK